MAEQTIHVTARVDTHEVKEAKKDFSELRGKVGELASEIPGLSSAMGALDGVTSGLAGAFEGAGGAMLGLAAAAGTAVLAIGALGAAMAFEWSEKIDALGDLGAKMGLTADQTYYLKGAMENAGLSVEALQGGQERLAKAMMKSGDDTKGAGAAFERLGVQTEDANGKLRSTADVLSDVAKKYQDEKGAIDMSKLSTQEMADLQLTLGKNYREVLLAEQERAKAQEVYNEMQEAGIGISQQAADLASEQETNNLKLGAVMNQVGGIMVELVIPAFNELISWFVKSYKEGGAVAQTFNMIGNVTGFLVQSLSFLIKIIGTVVESFMLLGSTAWSVMKAVNSALKLDFAGASSTINGAIDNFGTKLKEIGTRQIQIIKDGVVGTAKALGDVLTNRDLVGEAQARVKANPDNKNGNARLLPGGGVAGGVAPVGEAKEAKEKVDPIVRLIDSLEKQLRVADELNIAERVAQELASKKYANSDKQLKLDAQDLANKVAMADANKSLQQVTDDMNKQAQAAQGLNAVEALSFELAKKKNKAADEAHVAAAKTAAANLDQANATKLADAAVKSLDKSTDSYVKSLADELRQKVMTARQVREDQEYAKIDMAIQEKINELKEKHLWNLTEENRLLAEGERQKKRVRDATQAAQAADDNWLVNGVDSYLKGLGTMAEASQKLVDKGLKGIEEGLTSLFTGGDFSWRSFVKSIVDGLIQMMVQFMIMKPILEWFKSSMSSMGGGGGGFLGMIGSLFSAQGNVFSDHFAQGTVSSPTTGFFGPSGTASTIGEAGDEAVVPLKRNAAGDLGVQLMGGGGSQSNTYQQTNHITVQSSGNPADDKRQADAIAAAIDKKWAENMMKAQRPGGQLNRATLQL